MRCRLTKSNRVPHFLELNPIKMATTKENTWHTGDWNPHGSNPKVPYNGIKIIATANYGPDASPPVPQKLISVDLEVIDFTYSKSGVSSKVTLIKTGVGYDIPIPEMTTTSPPVPNPEFTVVGIDQDTLGLVKLDATSGGSYLNIQFRYGIKDNTREEIGYIMKFDREYKEGENPIHVEK